MDLKIVFKKFKIIDLKMYCAGQNRRGSANKSLKLITQINLSPCGRDRLVSGYISILF